MTIGNFDGVHRGHAAILKRVVAEARRRDVSPVAVTFDPHPAQILRGSSPPAISSLADRRERLAEAGIERVEVIEPTPDFLALSPADFVSRMVERINPDEIVEGPDFHFGRDRAGNIEQLKALGEQHGFAVEVVEPVKLALNDLKVASVSSSLVRWLLVRGRVEDAAVCLGRWHTLSAPVVEGDRRGTEIGFPTANLDGEALNGFACPGPGVYAAEVSLPDGTTHPGALSVGAKPTFGGAPETLEVHLLDFEGDLYGQTLSVSARRWLRDQQPFPSSTELVEQITRDVERVGTLAQEGELTDEPWQKLPEAVA
ncbi:MAG: riboflavin biosynthesis protein RibF [Phycisphaeraceae bacterium]|nr:riboflavin biosynthesis protein RibF [Phycisphaeraceae bacterium]